MSLSPNTIARRVVPLFLLIGAWALAGSLVAEEHRYVPTPMQVGRALWEMAGNGQLFTDAFASIRRVFFGFLLAAATGTLLGMVVGCLGEHSAWVSTPFELLRAIPPIAWIPLAILWFGIGETPAYFIVFLGAFFPIFTNAFAGVRSTEKTHVYAAQCLGASRSLLVLDVILPSALPSILTGLRIGFGVGWICVITAELVGAQSGLGYMIQLNRLLLRTDKVIAGMTVIGCLGFAFNQLLVLLEAKLLRWRVAETLA